MSRGPLRRSKRGSRCTVLCDGTTSRFRETAFLDDNSAGACLEARAKSLVSFLPAFRSRASDSKNSVLLLTFSRGFGNSSSRWPSSLIRFRFPKTSWASARAPKDIEAASSSRASSDPPID